MESTHFINLNLAEKLRKSAKYRRVFFKARARDDVALQIRQLRNERKLSQAKLAKAVGTLQSAISRIEDAEYSAWNFTTLLRVAEALDGCWELRLVKTEEVLKRFEEQQDLEQVRINIQKAGIAGTTYQGPMNLYSPSNSDLSVNPKLAAGPVGRSASSRAKDAEIVTETGGTND